MALSDDLADELASSTLTPTGAWIERWYETLDDNDQAWFDEYLADSHKQAAPLWRVCKKHGFPYSENPFREWVNARRGAI
jgi:hypothetical protein